ncbi:CBS domain-containing protein [Aliivibrio kagoshimensis]|uniref:CBS domain-containing protein n=1 Tax=Aliivibrio kagoshimensis TaxID=2910230 RepID=UPI003D0A94D0
MFKVSDMMTPNPHTLLRSNSIDDARNMMTEHDIHHVPIVDDEGLLLGLVTQKDLLSAQESSLQRQSEELDTNHLAQLSELMHKSVMTVSPHGGLKEAAKFMQKHKIGCLPILENGKLVGIITDTDFVGIAINLLELQEEVEPIEIFE